MEIVGSIQFTSFAVLHYDVEEAGVVVDFVDLDDVWVLQLQYLQTYEEQDLALIHVDRQVP